MDCSRSGQLCALPDDLWSSVNRSNWISCGTYETVQNEWVFAVNWKLFARLESSVVQSRPLSILSTNTNAFFLVFDETRRWSTVVFLLSIAATLTVAFTVCFFSSSSLRLSHLNLPSIAAKFRDPLDSLHDHRVPRLHVVLAFLHSFWEVCGIEFRQAWSVRRRGWKIPIPEAQDLWVDLNVIHRPM